MAKQGIQPRRWPSVLLFGIVLLLCGSVPFLAWTYHSGSSTLRPTTSDSGKEWLASKLVDLAEDRDMVKTVASTSGPEKPSVLRPILEPAALRTLAKAETSFFDPTSSLSLSITLREYASSAAFPAIAGTYPSDASLGIPGAHTRVVDGALGAAFSSGRVRAVVNAWDVRHSMTQADLRAIAKEVCLAQYAALGPAPDLVVGSLPQPTLSVLRAGIMAILLTLWLVGSAFAERRYIRATSARRRAEGGSTREDAETDYGQIVSVGTAMTLRRLRRQRTWTVRLLASILPAMLACFAALLLIPAVLTYALVSVVATMAMVQWEKRQAAIWLKEEASVRAGIGRSRNAVQRQIRTAVRDLGLVFIAMAIANTVVAPSQYLSSAFEIALCLVIVVFATLDWRWTPRKAPRGWVEKELAAPWVYAEMAGTSRLAELPDRPLGGDESARERACRHRPAFAQVLGWGLRDRWNVAESAEQRGDFAIDYANDRIDHVQHDVASCIERTDWVLVLANAGGRAASAIAIAESLGKLSQVLLVFPPQSRRLHLLQLRNAAAWMGVGPNELVEPTDSGDWILAAARHGDGLKLWTSPVPSATAYRALIDCYEPPVSTKRLLESTGVGHEDVQ